MTDSIKKYLSETPETLTRLLNNSKDLFKEVSHQDIKRIIVTGSGTSYHSGAEMQQLMREKSGILVEAYYPFMITRDLFKFDTSKTLLVGVSQGGSSFTTLDAMKIAKEKGCKIATISADKPAYIDQVADYPLTIDIGRELAGPKTEGYYATKLHLLLLAEYIGLVNGNLNVDQFNNDMNDLKLTFDQFGSAYEKALKWVEDHKTKLASYNNMRIVGPASLYGDVLESTLKLVESCREPVSGFEFNEFIHGIYNATNENTPVLFMDNGTENRMSKMLQILGKWTDSLYVFDLSDANDGNHMGYGVKVPKQFETFIFPLVFQVMAGVVSKERGIDADIPKDPNFHMEIGSKKYNH